MEIILLQNIRRLGQFGDVVKVKSGYGRNYLIPSGKAIVATSENLAEFEERKVALAKQAQADAALASQRQKTIATLGDITILRRVKQEDQLYGSVSAIDIVNSISERGVSLEKKEVIMPDGPIRELGEYDIDIHLHADVQFSIRVIVSQET